MSDPPIEILMAAGEKMGLTGTGLQEFIQFERNLARDKRAEERAAAAEERAAAAEEIKSLAHCC